MTAALLMGISSLGFAFEWPCCCCSHNNALAQAHACGGSNCKPRGIPTLGTRAQRKWKGRSAAEVCTSEARKIGEWLAGASGRSPVARVFVVAVRQGKALREGTARRGGWRRTRTFDRSQGGYFLPSKKRLSRTGLAVYTTDQRHGLHRVGESTSLPSAAVAATRSAVWNGRRIAYARTG